MGRGPEVAESVGASVTECSVCTAELHPGDEFCDACGSRVESAPRLDLARGDGVPRPAEPEAEAEYCPECKTKRSGRFCELDGYDFATGRQAERPEAFTPIDQGPLPPGPKVWTAVVSADRAYFDAVLAQGGPAAPEIAFPPYCPDRRVPMAGQSVRIGRRSASRGIEPEIDLSAPPEDPGVSRKHAVLLAQPDGTWTLVDLGSANGTALNDDLDPIPVNVPVPVKDGDRVHVGAWTTITLRSPE